MYEILSFARWNEAFSLLIELFMRCAFDCIIKSNGGDI